MLLRDQIISTLQKTLQPLEFVNALWEAGSASFGRIDEYSDIDLMVDVADEQVMATFEVIERALNTLSPIIDTYVIPQPSWHGHHQKFYRLRDTNEFLMIDVAVMQHSNDHKFLTREQHGEAIVLFDRAGMVKPPDFNEERHTERLRGRLQDSSGRMRLLSNLVRKELMRGQPLDALSYYNSLIIRPLVELLRIKHNPERYDFGARYLYYDLPLNEAKRLEGLMFVSTADDLMAKQEQALAWFWQLMAEMETRYDL